MTEASARDSYHHGDLRRAILDAAEAQLDETGLSGFSLRRIAARVGVSHTAPAHHFGDLGGLVDALAARGFQRLLAAMEARQAAAPDCAYDRLIGSGMGYLDFALAHRALFHLIFRSSVGEASSPELQQAAEAAMLHLAGAVAAARGLTDPGCGPDMVEVLTCWSRAHGIAGLMLSGYIDFPGNDGTEARDALFARMMDVHFPRP